MWAAFLQQPVMMRAQTVFTSMFRVSVEATLTAASAVTKEIKAGNTEVAEESDVGRRLWTHRKLQPNSGESNHPPTLKSEDTHTSAVGLAACPPSVRKVVEAFASTLADVVAQSRLLLDDRGDTATRGLNDPPPPFDLLGDAIEIRRFLQAACEKCVDDLVANIDKEVAAILAADDSFAVDRVLFLGRVCRETVQHVKQIEELMMLPASGKSALEGGKFVARTRRAANRRAAPTEHDTRLAAVRDKLLKVGREHSGCSHTSFFTVHGCRHVVGATKSGRNDCQWTGPRPLVGGYWGTTGKEWLLKNEHGNGTQLMRKRSLARRSSLWFSCRHRHRATC